MAVSLFVEPTKQDRSRRLDLAPRHGLRNVGLQGSYQPSICCSDRPPKERDGEHHSDSPAIGQPSTGNLKQSIADDEGREDPAHLLIGHSMGRYHLTRGHGNIDAVDIGDDADEKQQGEESAYPRGAIR